MANDSSKVRVGSPKVGGYALSATLGTAAPTDASTALNVAYKVLGLVSADGVTRSIVKETEKVPDWAGDTVRVLITETGASITLTLIEVNQNVLEEVYGVANVTYTALGEKYEFAYGGEVLPHKMYAFELKDGARVGRLAINDGQITNIGDVTYQNTAVIGHEVTIECFKDASGKYFHEYWADAA
jgi:hypothetical protein